MASRSTSRPFPGFSSIYELGTGSYRAFRVNIDVEGVGIRTTRGEVTLSGPVQARWFMGSKKPGDVIWTGFATPVLISERVVRLFRDHGFTGWSTYDVELCGHDGAPIPGYHGLSVHGRCGPIDNSKSVEMPRLMPGGVFPYYFGLYFDPDTWDGSDIFMPDEYVGWKFVVEGVKRALQKAKIRNVAFTSLVEIARMPMELGL